MFDASGFPEITPSLRFRSLKFLNFNRGQMLRLLVIRQIQVFRLLGYHAVILDYIISCFSKRGYYDLVKAKAIELETP